MKIAEVTTEFRQVTMHYIENWGYEIHSHGRGVWSNAGPYQSRTAAEKEFLWHVGYGEWEAAGEKAQNAARDIWLAEHKTLASVNAQDLRP